MLEPLIVFTLGYITGSVSALALIAFTLASRRRSSDRQRRHQHNTIRDT